MKTHEEMVGAIERAIELLNGSFDPNDAEPWLAIGSAAALLGNVLAAVALSSPCACGGREPLAEVLGHLRFEADKVILVVREHEWPYEEQEALATYGAGYYSRPVRVIILPAEEEKT